MGAVKSTTTTRPTTNGNTSTEEIHTVWDHDQPTANNSFSFNHIITEADNCRMVTIIQSRSNVIGDSGGRRVAHQGVTITRSSNIVTGCGNIVSGGNVRIENVRIGGNLNRVTSQPDKQTLLRKVEVACSNVEQSTDSGVACNICETYKCNVTILCGHELCAKCMKTLLLQEGATKCPTCRTDVKDFIQVFR